MDVLVAEGEGVEPSTHESARFSKPVARHPMSGVPDIGTSLPAQVG
jgi:hypothetical protein